MRLSQMLWVTLREDPAEAELISHKLLVRAGLIRRIAAGVYVYLPLMWRVLQKISQIVREELNCSGAEECLLTQLQPAELWQESGRWDTYTKAEGIMFALTDRMERPMGLGPTHEEVITAIAREMIRSYRQLPLHLYQIQTKFRDEIRPRFGLMRGREFIMKDGYSFHVDGESLKQTYGVMDRTYRRIFQRCGVEFCAVEADSGAIGGSGSQEFMVLAAAGEDEVLFTGDGRYAANVEKAVSMPPEAVPSRFASAEKLSTPNTETIDKTCAVLHISPTQDVKQVLYEAYGDGGLLILVLVSIRADQSVNEVKLLNELQRHSDSFGCKSILRLNVADAAGNWAAQPLPVGYIAPDLPDTYLKASANIYPHFFRLGDRTITDLKNFVTGTNEPETNWVGVNWGVDFQLPEHIADLRVAQAGDRAIHDPSQVLASARGIEVGHIFQLGTKYSQAMNATFTNEKGEELPLVMGCYGLGVSRLAQAAVEQSHDQDGIIWHPAIAPYTVIIIIPNVTDSRQTETATQIYHQMQHSGIDVLLDDRDERTGVKFKDADLVGIPYRVVTGRSIGEGTVEVVERATKQATMVPITEVVTYLKGLLDRRLARP
ncbi:MAG: proline--tRNA ligase [Oscillatoriales cyanobacterium SM2_2_1]|nr:proline--tRNA ligase [Oscillatoriales cyanobacterium SM2_2_1]